MRKHSLMLLAIFAIILWANFAYGLDIPSGSSSENFSSAFNESGNATEDGLKNGNSMLELTGEPEAMDDGLEKSNVNLNDGNSMLESTGMPEAIDDGLVLHNDTLNGNDTSAIPVPVPDTTGSDGMFDGNENEGDIASVGGDEDPLREMMAKQKEADDSVKAAQGDSQEQLPPPAENEPEQDGPPAKEQIQMRSMFEAEEEPANKVIVATDYLTGEELSEEEAKKTALITLPHEGYPKFQAMAAAGAIVPVIIHFKQLSSNCTHEDDGLSKPIFTINVCLKPKAKKCDGERVLICFVGKLDPDNNEFIELFQVTNFPDNEVAKQCNSKEVMDKWVEMGGKKEQMMHGLELNTLENQIRLITSFKDKDKVIMMKPYSDDNCVDIDIGIPEAQLIAQFRHADGVIHQNEKELMEKLVNAAPLREQDTESILAMDMMVNFNMSQPMLIFVGPKNADKCGMEITISGDSVKRCMDKECSSVADPSLSPNEEKKALYKRAFTDMVPVLAPDQLPQRYSKIIFLEKDPKNERPRAVLTTQGWELPFAVVTKDWEPPKLQIIHPPNAAFCTERDNFEINEFVLAYNGRPDCYGRLAWGERKIRFMDEMGGQSKVLIVDDAKLKIHGPNGDEFWSADQFNDDKMLGRGTCSIEAHQMAEDLNGDGKKIVWQMILSPLKGANTLRLPKPRCALGIGVYLDEYHLMVPKL